MDLVNNLGNFLSENVELIIVDDSADPLPGSFLSEFGGKLNYLHRGRKLGVSSARNLGSTQAKGNYLIFLDDDDEVTNSWIFDFESAILNQPDLVYCNMKLVAPSGKESSVSASKNNRGIVIPGAWMIRKSIFDQVEGYDERLKFAENTELFFRLEQLALTKSYLEKENFIYNQSVDGGSKNLQNMLDSTRLILEKHEDYLSAHVKHLYHQNIGVIEIRFRRFGQARAHLWKSWGFKPQKVSTLIRILLAYLPLVAKLVYKPTVAPR
jgi:glycosyltransferase involved in cell wall biosynthesis